MTRPTPPFRIGQCAGATDSASREQRTGGQKFVTLAHFEGQAEQKLTPTRATTAANVEDHWNPPFMPWFESDFQGSIRVRRLHRIARWIYGDLLRAAWHCDTAPDLPNDDEQLRAICGCSPADWKKHGPSVKQCFTPTTDGTLLYHPKLRREYEHALSGHQRKVAAGKSRWDRATVEPTVQIHNHEHKEVHTHTHLGPARNGSDRKIAKGR